MDITLDGFLRTLLLILAGVAVAFLAMLIWHLIGLIRRINGIVDSNRTNVDDSLRALPGAIKSAEEAMTSIKTVADGAEGVIGGIKGVTDKAGNMMGNVDRLVSGAAQRAGGTAGNIIEIARTVVEVVNYVKGLFKKKGDKKEDSGAEGE